MISQSLKSALPLLQRLVSLAEGEPREILGEMFGLLDVEGAGRDGSDAAFLCQPSEQVLLVVIALAIVAIAGCCGKLVLLRTGKIMYF